MVLAKYVVTISVKSDEELSRNKLDSLAGECVTAQTLHGLAMKYVPKHSKGDNWEVEVGVEHRS